MRLSSLAARSQTAVAGQNAAQALAELDVAAVAPEAPALNVVPEAAQVGVQGKGGGVVGPEAGQHRHRGLSARRAEQSGAAQQQAPELHAGQRLPGEAADRRGVQG